MDLTVIIPAYNEEKRIGAMLDDYLQYFQGRARFLVVVNGTTDHTLDVVQGYAKRFPGMVDCHEIREGVGKGGALVEGFRRVTSEWVGYADADGATPAEDFNLLLEELADADGAIASRFLPQSRIQRTLMRRVIGWTFRLLERLIIGLPYQDTQCGYKVFRRTMIERILPALTIRNMAFDVQLLALLHRERARIREVPVRWREIAVAGWPKNIMATSWDMFTTLFRIRRQLHLPPPTA